MEDGAPSQAIRQSIVNFSDMSSKGSSYGHDNTNNCRGGSFRPDARRFPGDLNLAFGLEGTGVAFRDEA